MNWHSVTFAALKRLLAFVRRDHAQPSEPTSGTGISHTAQPTNQTPSQCDLSLWERRALRKAGNTSRAEVAAYRQVHLNLSRGGSYD